METILPVSKRTALKNILFLTDFSEPSATALQYATMMARAYASKVTALHIVVPSVYTYMAGEMSVSVLDAEDDTVQKGLGIIQAQLAGLANELIIRRDTAVWPSLAKFLHEQDVDLIVLGTHGRTGLKKLMFGSTAEEVFRRTSIPVLTVGPAVRRPAHKGEQFKCVLFATDFNPVSSVAASYAMSLAQENQSRLVLLHVLPTPKLGKNYRSTELSVAEALHRVQDLLPRDAELWCRPEPVVEHGRPDAQILATAERRGADLIVLGVRGMDRLAELAARTDRAVAYEVIAHAPCPVLTLRG
jgi:nucleotide-binding universal stress UspA family protein